MSWRDGFNSLSGWEQQAVRMMIKALMAYAVLGIIAWYMVSNGIFLGL